MNAPSADDLYGHGLKGPSDDGRGGSSSPNLEQDQSQLGHSVDPVSTAKGAPTHCPPSKLDIDMEGIHDDLLETEEADEDSDAPLDEFSLRETTKVTAERSKFSPPITLELLSKGGYYDMPMSKVAQLLGRTEGSFQRVCRALGIVRWPYRVRKSLQAIMEKTEQYLDDDTQEDGLSKAEVLSVLQGHMDDIKGISGSGMDKATKQYRQYIFKVNHKLSRRAAKLGAAAVGENHKVRGMLKAASKIQKPGRHSEVREVAVNGAFDGLACDVCDDSQSQPRIRSTALQSGSPKPEPALTSEDMTPSPTAGNAAANNSLRSSPPTIPGAGIVSSDSGKSFRPMRPTPRHFRDLPASLAFEPLGREKAGPSNIMGRMATSAAVQNRLRSGTPEEYRQLCMRGDTELLQLCFEMDAHLEAAKRALTSYNQDFHQKCFAWSRSSLMDQQCSSPVAGMDVQALPRGFSPVPLLTNGWALGSGREL